MPRTRLLTPLAALSLGAFLFGCPPEDGPDVQPPEPRPITSAELLQDANLNLRTHIMGGAISVESVGESDLLGRLLPFGDSEPAPCPPDSPCEPEPEADPTEAAAQMADMMAAEVLNAIRIEETLPTQLTLRLDAALCSQGEGTADPECMQDMATMQPRLRMISLREGDVTISVLVGAERASVATLELHRTHLAVELDLAAAKTALLGIAEVLAEPGDETVAAVRAATVQGRLRATLAPDGGQAYALAIAVPARILIETAIEGETVRLEVQPANPAIELSIDPVTPEVRLQARSGGARLTGPLALFANSDGQAPCRMDENGQTICDEEPAEDIEGILDIELPSASARLVLTRDEQLHIEDIAMSAPLRVRVDARTVIEAQIGSANGGSFDLDILAGQDDLQIQVSPSARALLDLDLAPIAELAEVPAWLLSERLEVRLDGAAAPTLRVANDNEQIQVVDGRLFLDSRAANRQITVTAGQCLVANDQEPMTEEPHPFELLEAGPCN